jgi:hypothetical protein
MCSSLLLIFVTSCVATPQNVVLTTEEAGLATISPPPTEIPASETAKPTIEKSCPQNQQVPIDELNLPHNLVLLAVGEEEILGGNLGTPLSSDVLRYSGGDLPPEKIEGIRFPEDDPSIVNILMSPKGKWLAIFRWNETNNQEALWLSTLDGQEQRKIADISPKQRISWVSDSEILVVGVLNEADYEGRIPDAEMHPLWSINPLSSEIQILEPLPEGAVYIHGSYHSTEGHHYSLYYLSGNQNRTYFLYDYVNKKATKVFGWVDSFDDSISVGIRRNGLYFVERKSGLGIDFAMDLTIEQIAEGNNYNNIMNHLAIDNIEGSEITSMLASLTINDILVLTSHPLDNEKPTPMYLFDYETNVLKDYCINLGYVSAVFSPDEKFVAFTVNEGIDNPGYHVLILDLETGYYSIIQDIKAIGIGINQ